MKKILFVSAAILSLSLMSCKKDYTCVCTDPIFGSAFSLNAEAKSSKKGAEEWCKSFQNGSETVDGVASPADPINCSIK